MGPTGALSKQDSTPTGAEFEGGHRELLAKLRKRMARNQPLSLR